MNNFQPLVPKLPQAASSQIDLDSSNSSIMNDNTTGSVERDNRITHVGDNWGDDENHHDIDYDQDTTNQSSAVALNHSLEASVAISNTYGIVKR